MNILVDKTDLIQKDGSICVLFAVEGLWSTDVSSYKDKQKRMFDQVLIRKIANEASREEINQYIQGEYKINNKEFYRTLVLNYKFVDPKETFFIQSCCNESYECGQYEYRYEEIVLMKDIYTFSFISNSYSW